MKGLAVALIVMLFWQGLALAQIGKSQAINNHANTGPCISGTNITLDMRDAISNLPSPVGHEPASLSSTGWCVDEVLGLPYIEIEFEDVVLVHNGTIEAINGSLVTAVQLQRTLREDEEFQYIIDMETELPAVSHENLYNV